MLYAILIAILLIADQWVKYWTTINIVLETGEAEFIPGFVKLVNVHNSGAAFGFMNSVEYMRWIFAGLAVVIAVVLVIVMIRRVFPGKFPMILCAVAIAGSLGNCIDRFIYGYVVDMFKLEFVNFAIFNVADILLTVSCFLFILYLIFGYKGSKYEEEYDDDDEYYESDGDVEAGELESEYVEEDEPAKPIEIDSAFWGSDNEPIKRRPEREVRFVPPVPESEPEEAPAEEIFDSAPAFDEAEPEPEESGSIFDGFSIDSILDEFK